MADIEGFLAIGVRLSSGGTIVHGTFARLFVHAGAARPARVSTGALEWESGWQLEDLVRDADFVTWEKHPVTGKFDEAPWAFEQGRINGRLETLTAAHRGRRKSPAPDTWRRHYGTLPGAVGMMKRKWDLEHLSLNEMDAVLIGWWGWINSPEHGA